MNGKSRYLTTPRSAEGRNTDTEEISALLNVGSSQAGSSVELLVGLQPMLSDLEQLFGETLPADIEIKHAPGQNPALREMSFAANYDEVYCGHLSIPNQDGTAASIEQVMAEPQPLQFIKNNLNFGTQDNGEWVIFTPGLNTLHQVKPGWEGEQTAPQRLAEQYQPILGIQMAHMHLGTDMDQGDAEVMLPPETRLFLEMKRPELEGAGIMPEMGEETAVFQRRQRDRIETVLSVYGRVRVAFRTHVVQLLEASKAASQPIVWLAYSRSSSELCRALNEYIQIAVNQRGESLSEVEDSLREHLTVVTVGNAIRAWPDGPAYIHYSALSDRSELQVSPPKLWGTDPLTFQRGVHAMKPQGAGKDAVFLHFDGLFRSFDTHNFGSVGAAALKLIMDINGLTTFRAIWEQGKNLKIPSDWQIAAKVVETEGEKWLWSKEDSLNSYRLPNAEQAQQILTNLP
ncbi:MAG: hypothetical protein AAFY72_07710 [Cyanobacteria bacterium J06649_4]